MAAGGTVSCRIGVILIAHTYQGQRVSAAHVGNFSALLWAKYAAEGSAMLRDRSDWLYVMQFSPTRNAGTKMFVPSCSRSTSPPNFTVA
jgi:hypothetical protein